MKKWIGIAAAVLICAIVGLAWYVPKSWAGKDGHVSVTAVSVDSIAEKFHDEDGYFLTVDLGDELVEEFNLSYDKVSIRTRQGIYDMVSPGEVCAGVTLKISWPEKPSPADVNIRPLLKEKQTDRWEIISVTTADNFVIDGT